MTLYPAPHVYMVVSNDDVIVLDLATDRYLGLPGAIVAGGTDVRLGTGPASLDSDAAQALEEAGLIVAGDSIAVPAIGLPLRALDRDISSPRPSLRDMIDLLIALGTTGWRLWRGCPCRTHARSRTLSIMPADPERLEGHVARLAHLRLVVPTPQRCLPSALLTSLWLRRKGLCCEIVFGVRTHPFEAHCWVEHDGVVLDDDLDRLRSYTPIAVGVP